MITRKTRRDRSRRHLGHGQFPGIPQVTATAVPVASTAVVTFDRPVVITGPVPLAVATRAFVSQVVNSETQVTITYNGTTAAKAYSYPSNDPTVKGSNGGTVAAFGGTFP